MKTIYVKVSGEKTEVKLLKKFKVLDFNLAIVDFPYKYGSCKTVVEFSTGMKIGFLRSHKNYLNHEILYRHGQSGTNPQGARTGRPGRRNDQPIADGQREHPGYGKLQPSLC